MQLRKNTFKYIIFSLEIWKIELTRFRRARVKTEFETISQLNPTWTAGRFRVKKTRLADLDAAL